LTIRLASAVKRLGWVSQVVITVGFVIEGREQDDTKYPLRLQGHIMAFGKTRLEINYYCYPCPGIIHL